MIRYVLNFVHEWKKFYCSIIFFQTRRDTFLLIILGRIIIDGIHLNGRMSMCCISTKKSARVTNFIKIFLDIKLTFGLNGDSHLWAHADFTILMTSGNSELEPSYFSEHFCFGDKHNDQIESMNRTNESVDIFINFTWFNVNQSM